MKRSKIIVELIRDEMNVVQAMEVLNLLLQESKDTKIQSWLNSEINGYIKGEEIPEYRIVSTRLTGTYLIDYGYKKLQCTDQPLPVKAEYFEEFRTINVMSGLNEVLQLSLAEKENETHSLKIPIDIVYMQGATLINGEIIDANRILSVYSYTNILNKLKSKVLNIFIELEKNFGNLDDYHIDFKDKKDEIEISQTIINIITDNSVSIGDNNKIKDTKIGVANEN